MIDRDPGRRTRAVRDGPLPPRARRRPASSGKRMRPLLGLLAYAVDRRRPRSARCPAPRPSSSATTSASSTTTSRTATRSAGTGPTLWTVHGVPQAINTGDTLFTLSRMALHRLTRPRLLRRQGPAPDAPLRRDLPRAVRGPVHRHRDSRARRADVGRPLLRHDRSQDRGPDRRPRSRRARCWPPTTTRSSTATARFGWALGLAFQLNDDLLGIWGDEAGDRQGAVATSPTRRRRCR